MHFEMHSLEIHSLQMRSRLCISRCCISRCCISRYNASKDYAYGIYSPDLRYYAFRNGQYRYPLLRDAIETMHLEMMLYFNIHIICISRLCTQYLFSRCKILCILKCIVSRSIVSRYKIVHSLKIHTRAYFRYAQLYNRYYASRDAVSRDVQYMHLETMYIVFLLET